MRLPGPKTTMAVQRVTETADGLGGVTESWSTIANIEGVLSAGGNTTARFVGREKMIHGKSTVLSSLIFYCDVPEGITITEKDRMYYDSKAYDIVFVYNPGNMNHHLEISLFEAQ